MTLDPQSRVGPELTPVTGEDCPRVPAGGTAASALRTRMNLVRRKFGSVDTLHRHGSKTTEEQLPVLARPPRADQV